MTCCARDITRTDGRTLLLYQELTLDADVLAYPPAVMLPLFAIGIVLTFAGVGIISSG